MSKFTSLFEPLKVGSVTVRNRILQPGHSKVFSQNGVDSQRDLDYYVARARGGVGLLITGERLVHPSSSVGRSRFAYSYRREMVNADRRIAKAVHAHDTLIFAQLNHVGLEGSGDADSDLRHLFAPTEMSSPLFGETGKAMDEHEIRQVVEWFGRSAELTREGGLDGIEIHVAHGYLLSQFLSPLYNHRDDEYGGALENRLRFTREVLTEIRHRVGDDYPLGVRLGLSESMPGGLEIEDAIEVTKILVADGDIDFLNTSAGGYHSGQQHVVTPSDTEDGYLLDQVAQVKDVAGAVPVFAVGSLRDGTLMNEVIESGRADMVGLVRALIADPELPNKLRADRPEQINHCIKGNQGCISRVWRGLPMACTVNPAAGREGALPNYDLDRVADPKRWMVVGGGPAGMKAAVTLACRGHEVTLLEREQSLGGQVLLAARAPGRNSFLALVEDLTLQLYESGVTVRLGREVSTQDIFTAGPDGVILAVGATPDQRGYSSAIPAARILPGLDEVGALTTWDAMSDPSQAGESVVVLDDQGTREVAGAVEMLLDAGKKVLLITRWGSLFPALATSLDQPVLVGRLLRKGLKSLTNSWATHVDAQSVQITHLLSGEASTIGNINTILVATGRRSEVRLYDELVSSSVKVVRVGDCVAPRKLDHAIFDGYMAGLERDPNSGFFDEGQLEPWRSSEPLDLV